jgi:hypothetical protein
MEGMFQTLGQSLDGLKCKSMHLFIFCAHSLIALQILNKQNKPEFGEVYYYFQIPLNNDMHTLALVSMYTPPIPGFAMHRMTYCYHV